MTYRAVTHTMSQPRRKPLAAAVSPVWETAELYVRRELPHMQYSCCFWKVPSTAQV